MAVRRRRSGLTQAAGNMLAISCLLGLLCGDYSVYRLRTYKLLLERIKRMNSDTVSLSIILYLVLSLNHEARLCPNACMLSFLAFLGLFVVNHCLKSNHMLAAFPSRSGES